MPSAVIAVHIGSTGVPAAWWWRRHRPSSRARCGLAGWAASSSLSVRAAAADVPAVERREDLAQPAGQRHEAGAVGRRELGDRRRVDRDGGADDGQGVGRRREGATVAMAGRQAVDERGGSEHAGVGVAVDRHVQQRRLLPTM